MTRIKIFAPVALATVLTTVLAFGCSSPAKVDATAVAPAFSLDSVRSIVQQQNKAFTAAHVDGNVGAIDSMFTNNARSYPPGAAAAIGIQAIHALTVEFLKIGVTEFRETTTAFHGNAEYVIDEGTYTLTYGKGTTERGKYLNVWKYLDGKWRIDANMWNEDAK